MGFRAASASLMRWRGHGRRRRSLPRRHRRLGDVSTSTATRSAPTAAPSSPTSPHGRRPSPARAPTAAATCCPAPAAPRTQIGPLVATRRDHRGRAARARPRRRRRHGRRRRAGARRRLSPRTWPSRGFAQRAPLRPHGARPRRDRRHACARPRHRRPGARLMRWQDLPRRRARGVPRRHRHPGASARARRRAPPRRAPPARADPLLPRRRRRRPRGRRAHHAVRDPRRRALRAGAASSPSRPRGRGRARARWSWSPASPAAPQQAVAEAPLARELGYHAVPAQPRGVQGRARGRADRPLPGPRRRDAADRLLPAAGGRRPRAARARSGTRFAAIENVVGDQGRAVRPLPHARRRARRRRRAGAQDRISLYTGNDDHIVLDLVTPFRMPRRPVSCASSAACSATGRSGRAARSSCSSAARPRARPRRRVAAPTCWRSTARVTDCNAAFFDVANEFRGVHRRLPRGAAPAGPARGHAGASTRPRT